MTAASINRINVDSTDTATTATASTPVRPPNAKRIGLMIAILGFGIVILFFDLVNITFLTDITGIRVDVGLQSVPEVTYVEPWKHLRNQEICKRLFSTSILAKGDSQCEPDKTALQSPILEVSKFYSETCKSISCLCVMEDTDPGTEWPVAEARPEFQCNGGRISEVVDGHTLVVPAQDGIGRIRVILESGTGEWLTPPQSIQLEDTVQWVKVELEGLGLTETHITADVSGDFKAKSSEENLSVLVVVLDSVTRQSFMRYMPQTREYLMKMWNGELPDSEHQAFMFNRFNQQVSGTPYNMLPMLMGRYWPTKSEDHRKETRHLRVGKFTKVEEFLPYQLRQEGWFTFYGYPGGNEFFGARKHDEITKPSFTRLAHTVVDHDYYQHELQFSDAHGWQEPCKESAQPTQHMADATVSLWHRKDVQKFAYMHSDVAHCGVDIDLMTSTDETIMRLLQRSLKADPNTLLILMGDHGRFQSRRNPLMTMVLPTNFLKRHNRIAQSLEINQGRMLSFFDVHVGLRYLATLNSSISLPPIEREQSVSPKYPGLNMFTEISPYNRTCEEANIPPTECICNPWKEMPKEDLSLVEYVLKYLNSQPGVNEGRCHRLELDSISWQQISSDGFVKTGEFFVKQGHKGVKSSFIATLTSRQVPSRNLPILTELTHLEQTSRWGQFRACKPDNARADYCVCDVPEVDTNHEQDD